MLIGEDPHLTLKIRESFGGLQKLEYKHIFVYTYFIEFYLKNLKLLWLI